MSLRSRSTFIAGSASLALAAMRAARAQSPLPTLRIGVSPADGYAQAWYAQDEGFFAKAGVPVDLLPFNSGSAAAAAVAGGSLDIAITTPIPLANAVIRGVPFVIIASAAVNTPKAPQLLIITRKSGTVRAAKDLIGKTVGVNTLKTLLELGLDVYLTKNNVEIPQVRVVEVLFSEMGAAIDRGTIDAAVIGEPQLSAALKANDVRVLVDPMALIAPRFVSAVWFTTQQFAQRNPDAIKRFVSVMYDTARWANRHHLESGRILVKYTKMNVEDVSTMIRADFAEQTRVSEIQPLLDACAKYNYIPRPIAASELLLR
jgi:NitT/TauT family transport system substrate-binding protein